MFSRSNFALLALATLLPSAASGDGKTRFQITYPGSAHAGPLTGRAYVIVSRTNEKEPRLQVGRTGVPFFGRDFESLRPGEPITLDADDLGSPVDSFAEIPAAEYYVQAFINIYSEFKRKDGHLLWMHDDRWEGQHWQRSPGNLYSLPRRLRLDASEGYLHEIEANQAIPPIDVPPDTAWVKRFRFESKLLTEFWGQPIYLGATVLLPRDYERETMSYPVVYVQGHFSLADPMGWKEGEDLYRAWTSDRFPRMIVVTLQDPNPYFDTSYSVNSLNVGPYGDAIQNELIPEVERRFRILRKPYARILTGGSTGGWEALALQIFHPDFYGGAFAYSPDPVSFLNVEGIDIYKDENAFYKRHDWLRVPIANTRSTSGEVRLTSQQRNQFELVSGTRGRSGEQLDIWSAVFGPLGPDGYFQPLFDKRTGVIDRSVADFWRENFDLVHHLKRNWASVGPKLVSKIHVYCGDMDDYYLNVAVKELEVFLKSTENPHYPGVFIWGDGQGHRFGREFSSGAERIRRMAEHVLASRPEGEAHPWWDFGTALE